MDVLVFGAGSLGSLLGGLLARDHDVTLVGRDPHVAAVREDGLEITGAIEARVWPEAVTAVADADDGRGWDLAVVAVKAYDTDAAAAALADPDLGACLSVQNGLGNEERLAADLDCPVLAGTCTYGARLTEPGRVECTGVGEVTLGPCDGGESTAAGRVGAAFDDASVETVVAEDMPRRLWEKLAVNAGINATTALADLPNGALLDGPANDLARTAAREAASVARSDGVALPDDAAVTAVEAVAADTARNTSSMRQDLQRDRRTEIGAINGAVVEQAEEPVPVNETLARLVRAWERERGLR